MNATDDRSCSYFICATKDSIVFSLSEILILSRSSGCTVLPLIIIGRPYSYGSTNLDINCSLVRSVLYSP